MSTQTTLNPKRFLGMLPISAISASAATGSGTSINDPFIANNYYQLYSVLSNNGLNRKAQYVEIGADFNTQNMNGYSGLVRDDTITINAQKHLDLNGKKLS